MNRRIYLISSLVLLSVVSLRAQSGTVGGDKDEHGCRASAGYTFSIVKNECIRLFEQETRLNEVNPSGTSTSAATIIFSADKKKAEAFIPDSKGGVILARKGKEGSYTWEKGKILLSQKGKGYILKKNNTIIFSSEAASGS